MMVIAGKTRQVSWIKLGICTSLLFPTVGLAVDTRPTPPTSTTKTDLEISIDSVLDIDNMRASFWSPEDFSKKKLPELLAEKRRVEVFGLALGVQLYGRQIKDRQFRDSDYFKKQSAFLDELQVYMVRILGSVKRLEGQTLTN